MKDIEYKDVANQISGLKERYIAAQESGNAEEMASVMIDFNNIKSSVDDHKAFRETITDPEYGISDAMKHSGVEPGDNGEDHNFLTGLIKEDYEITRENGETYYNVGGVKKTMKEIKDMTILKDNIPYAAYSKAVNDFSKAKNWDRDNTEYHVRNNVIPQNKNGLRAFLADNGFGNGQTFSQVLNAKGNRASIEKEIMNSVFNTDGGGIDDKEWENFTNAIVDPKNEFWKGDEQASEDNARRIATEQLTNGIENKWVANQPEEEQDTVDSSGFTLLRSNKSSEVTGKGGGFTPNSSLNYIGKNANDRADIDLGGDKFIWDKEKNAYTLDGEVINNKYSLFSTIYGDDFDPANIINMYSGIEDWQADTRQKDTFDDKTNLDIDFVNQKDESVATDLNDLIPSPSDTRNPEGYVFKPLAAFENMTGIYKEGGGIETFPKVYPEGHPKAGEKHPKAGKKAWFRTKGKTTKNNIDNLAQMIDLLQTFGLYEHVGKQGGSNASTGGGNVRQ